MFMYLFIYDGLYAQIMEYIYNMFVCIYIYICGSYWSLARYIAPYVEPSPATLANSVMSSY